MRSALLLALAACSGHHATAPDAEDVDAATPDAPDGCHRVAAAPDRVRHVVISHPFDAAGNNANNWDVLDLSATGDLSMPGRPFVMGRANEGLVEFTSDGAIGVVAQADGTLGVFSLADDGTPHVVAAGFKGHFYAQSVLVHGDQVYVVDPDTTANGGGIYRVDLACDGTPTEHGLVAAANTPGGLAFIPGTDRAVVAASQLAGSPAGADAELVTWGEPPTLLGSSDAFGDDTAIVGSTALTYDGTHFLLGDRAFDHQNRVAIVQVDAAGLTKPQVLPMVDDPFSLVASPFGDVVLVVDGFGNAMFVLDTNAAGFKLRGEVAYTGAKPQLPGAAARIDVGSLKGWVLVEENLGVRTVELKQDGSVVDHGVFAIGNETDESGIVGALGVTP